MPPDHSPIFEHVLDLLESLELDALVLGEGRAVKTLITPTPQLQWVCVVECVALGEASAMAAFSRIVLESEDWAGVWPQALKLVNLINRQALTLGALELDPEDQTLSLRTALLWPNAEPPTRGQVRQLLETNWAEFESILPALSALLQTPESSPETLMDLIL